MSLRNMFQGSIVKPGFNPLAAQTSVTTYYYYLYGWGYNGTGQLGQNNITSRSSPVQVGSSYWTQASAGSGSCIAVKNDGTLWAWGKNALGNLGLGNTTYYSSPKQVGALTNWAKTSTGASGFIFSMAIKTDGSLWAVGGRNVGTGSLGLGNTTNYSSPKQVGSLTNWSDVQSGYLWSLATKTDGTLWSWGLNAYGNLGLGNTTYYSSPKQIGSLTNWATISCGFFHGVAVKTDGTLWTWGANGGGQLGIGAGAGPRQSPVQVGALTNWLKVSASSYCTLAVKTDGTLWAWGQNGSGELGLGDMTNRSSPVQVGALTNWSNCTNGDYSSMAVKTDGTLWSWGAGGNGQLGIGNTSYYSSPKQVGSNTTWALLVKGITGSSAFAMAY